MYCSCTNDATEATHKLPYMPSKSHVIVLLIQLALLFAVSYISHSTLRAYETSLPMRQSIRAAESRIGVGRIAVTLQQ